MYDVQPHIYHGIHDRSSHQNVKHYIYVIFNLLDVSHRALENSAIRHFYSTPPRSYMLKIVFNNMSIYVI